MKKTVLVMLHEIRTSLRRKSFVIMALGLPLALGIVAVIMMTVNRDGSTATASARARTVDAGQEMAEGYVDHGGLIRVLPDDIPAGWLTEYPDEAAAQAALEAGQIVGYYLIPADYVESGNITYVRQTYSPLSDRASTAGIEWILLANLVPDLELAAAVRQPLDLQVTALAQAGAQTDEDNWIVELLPTLMAVILYMAIILPSGTLVNAVTDEKKNRVMEVLMSSISSEQMITGKILAIGLLGLLQLALWMGVLLMVVHFGGRPLDIPAGFTVPTQLVVWAFVYALLGYAMYGAQMAGVGALAPDVKDTRSVSFIVLAPIIVVYVFLVAIVLAPDGPFALAMSLFPLTSPVAMIARMTQTTVPLWQAVLAAALQLLTAIWIVRLVARLFHAQHLLSGQPFSVASYYRALLGRA